MAISDLMTLLIRFVFLLLVIASVTYLPYKIWNFGFLKKTKNPFARTLKRVSFIMIGIVLALTAIVFILASIWSFEQTSGNCIGFSCPLTF